MNKFRNIFMCAVSAYAIYSCAVKPDSIVNEDAIDEFEAWIGTYYPDAEKTGLGVYVLSQEPAEGNGTETIDDADYIMVNYVVRDLKGQISAANTEEMAKQLGNYTSEADSVNYYGPAVWNRSDNSITAGIKELISGMKEGETKTGAIPSWLATTASYSTEDEYRKNVTGNSHSIYTITVEKIVESTEKNDMNSWQIALMEEFIKNHSEEGGTAYSKPMPGFEGRTFPKAILDTIWTEERNSTYMGSVYGLYFDNGKPLVKAPDAEKTDSTAFSNTDTTFTINYTGRRLLPKYDGNGKLKEGFDEQIFDTTIEDLAKDAGIYKEGKTYQPVTVKWSENASGITLGGSTVIPGFYTALWNMQYKHKLWDTDKDAGYRKAVAIFYSPYGYGVSGSGNMIPAYAPLMFEIEIINEKDED